MIYDFIKTIRADQARRMLGVADEGVVSAALENLHAVWVVARSSIRWARTYQRLLPV